MRHSEFLKSVAELEVAGLHWIVEIKMEKEVASETVIAKAKAAQH